MQPSLRALPGGNAMKALSNVMLMLTYLQVKESFICGICLAAVSPTIYLFSSFNLQQESKDESPCDKFGAHSGYSFRNLVARARK